jgi:hypothetical protein
MEKKLWYIHSIECYLEKDREISSLKEIWRNIKYILPSKKPVY